MEPHLRTAAGFSSNSQMTPTRTPVRQAPAQQARQWHPEDNNFRDHIHHRLREHMHKGVNGGGEEKIFVCRDALTDYWVRERIVNVLNRDDNTQAHAEVIENDCLITFSILCYVSYSAYFNHFTSLQISDGLLPITPSHYSDCQWSGDAGFCNALARFCEAQWKFTPLVFDTVIHRRALPAECILPVVFDKTTLITSGLITDECAVYRAMVHPCCVGPKFRRHATTGDVVFKMLSSDETDLWDNEVNAYNFLARSSPDQVRLGKDLTTTAQTSTIASAFNFITRCLGSFTRNPPLSAASGPSPRADSGTAGPPRDKNHDGPGRVTQDVVEKTHVILLEYARGGNLATFCENHADLVKSTDRDDRVNLWHQMFHLLRGLSAVHSSDGTHQDIKESNILCMYEDGSLRDRDRVCFKLADFGKSHFKRAGGTAAERRDTNNLGNRTYMAPECCGADEIEQAVPRDYTKEADIWSMGCLFSDMLVRSSLGQEGVNKYRQARIAANKHTAVRDYAPQCFHNGIERLLCVDEFHHEALENHPEDNVLRAVSDIILGHMLQPRAARADDALTLRSYWINHIMARDSTSTPVPAGTSSVASAVAPSSQTTTQQHLQASQGSAAIRPPPPPPSFPPKTTMPPTTNPRPPTAASISSVRTWRAPITVRQIAGHLQRPQKLWFLLRSGVKLETAFPGLLSALSIVGRRNHHFLVDSSETMAQHRDRAAETIWVLSKLLKPRVSRRDSVKLSILADNEERVYVLRKSSEFANIVRKFEFGDARSWLLGVWLERTAVEIMDGLVKAQSLPINLYILTDGEFGDEPPEFATPIQALVQKLRERQTIMPSFFSITIIQFGDSLSALQALVGLRQTVSSLADLPPQFNPIRICSCDADVADMLIGRIRDNTTNTSVVGWTTRRNTEGIPNG